MFEWSVHLCWFLHMLDNLSLFLLFYGLQHVIEKEDKCQKEASDSPHPPPPPRTEVTKLASRKKKSKIFILSYYFSFHLHPTSQRTFCTKSWAELGLKHALNVLIAIKEETTWFVINCKHLHSAQNNIWKETNRIFSGFSSAIIPNGESNMAQMIPSYLLINCRQQTDTS